MNKNEFKTILTNWNQFLELIQPLVIKKCQEIGCHEIIDDLNDEYYQYNISCDEEGIRIFWTEEYSDCSCCRPEKHDRSIYINEEEIQELMKTLPDCPKEQRIKELEERLIEETRRRRELERSKPTGSLS